MMSEGPPHLPIFPDPNSHESRRKKIIDLALELSERPGFPFPGLARGVYERLKSDEAETMGFATPIDTLIARFENEGVKVVLGKNPESGNVFVLPSQSNDIENDNLFPRHLNADGVIDEKFKELILLSRRQIIGK